VKASPTTVGTVRAEMEAKGDVSKLDTRRDSKGRKQPAKKKKHKRGRMKAKFRRDDVIYGEVDPNIEESPKAIPWDAGDNLLDKLVPYVEEDNLLDDQGNYAPMDPDADAACHMRGFMYRGQQSVFAAEDLLRCVKDLPRTKEVLELVDAVISAWTKLRQQMETKGEPRSSR